MSSSLEIRKMILHKIDRNLSLAGPVVSDVAPTISPEVQRFLGKHISDSENHRYARSAEFVKPDTDGIVILDDVCNCIFNDTTSFVGKSKEIANHLFDKDTHRPGQPSASDLIICSYGEVGSDDEWLALLKMEPDQGFVAEAKTDSSGQTYYALRLVEDIIVSNELQKSALIAPPSVRATLGYDLRLLDNQQSRSGINQIAASFFVSDFLQCKVGLNAADKTRSLLIGGGNWLESRVGVWSGDDIDDAREQLRNAALSKKVDLTTLAQNITDDQDEQDNFVESMSKRIKETVFDTDPSTAKDITKWTVFEGDRGIKVSVPSDLVGNDKYFERKFDEATNTFIITIKTANFKTKQKRRA